MSEEKLSDSEDNLRAAKADAWGKWGKMLVSMVDLQGALDAMECPEFSSLILKIETPYGKLELAQTVFIGDSESTTES